MYLLCQMHAGCFGEILQEEGFTLCTVVSLLWSHMFLLDSIQEKIQIYSSFSMEKVKPEDNSDLR